MKIAAHKTIFIALGGTGATIVEHLRDRMEQRIGTSNLPFLRYLYIDTDQNSLDKIRQRHLGDSLYTATNQMAPNKSTIRAIIDPQSDQRISHRLRIDHWFDAHLKSQLNEVSFTMGVAGTRMYSRLAFLASENLEALTQQIVRYEGELRAYDPARTPTIADVDPPYLTIVPSKIDSVVRFVVIASSGGGTGSGSFYDLGYLIRRLAERHGWRRDDVSLTGHMAIGRAGIGAPQVERNTAALLTEIDFYNDEHFYSVNDITMNDGQDPWRMKGPPYEFTYLLQPTQGGTPLDGDPKAAFQKLEWRMAEYQLINTIYPFDDRIDPSLVNMPAGQQRGVAPRRKDATSQNPRLQWTYGIVCREWPAALVHRHLYGRLLSSAAQQWLQPSEKGTWETLQKLRAELGLQDEVARANNTARALSDDRLFTELTRAVDGFEPAPQIERCKELAFADGAFDVAKLEQVATQLRTCFMYWEGPPSAGNGRVYAIIRANLARLTQGPDARRTRVADLILEQCRKNPATAARVARQLQPELRAEMALIESILPTLVASIAVSPSTLEECWRFANDQYLRLVLDAKLELYRSLLPWLDQLVERLNRFNEYIQAWVHALESRTVKLETAAPSVVLPVSTVTHLETTLRDGVHVDLSQLEEEYEDARGRTKEGILRQLRTLVREGLPEKDALGNPTLLARDIPKINGRPDFSHLQRLEKNLFEAIARSKASPYDVEILPLLRQDGNELPNLMKECAPLLHFQADHDYYGTGRFGMAANLLTRVYQINQEGSDTLDRLDAAGNAWVAEWGGGLETHLAAEVASAALPPWSITYWVERCSIQTDLIVGYSRTDRLNLFEIDGLRTPFTNVTIVPPADRATTQRARALLMGTQALHVWTRIGRNQGFTWEYKVGGADGYERQAVANLSDEYRRATHQIASDKTLMRALERHVSEWLKSHSGAAADKMQAAVRTIEAARLGTTAPTDSQAINASGGGNARIEGPLLDYGLQDVRYDEAIDALFRFVTMFDIPVPKAEHPWARFLAAGAENPATPGQTAPQEGWYCQQCGLSAGRMMPDRQKSCEKCHFPSTRGSDAMRVESHR